jgi:hypothetical protein
MSSIDAAVTALVAVFATAAPGVQVIDGPPDVASVIGQQVIAVADQEIIGISDFDSLAMTTMTEDYVIPVTVSVSIPGSSMSAARNAVIALYETLKAAVVANPGLSISSDGSFRAFPVEGWSLPQMADENGRNAAFRFGIRVIATNT